MVMKILKNQDFALLHLFYDDIICYKQIDNEHFVSEIAMVEIMV